MLIGFLSKSNMTTLSKSVGEPTFAGGEEVPSFISSSANTIHNFVETPGVVKTLLCKPNVLGLSLAAKLVSQYQQPFFRRLFQKARTFLYFVWDTLYSYSKLLRIFRRVYIMGVQFNSSTGHTFGRTKLKTTFNNKPLPNPAVNFTNILSAALCQLSVAKKYSKSF